MIIQVTLDTNCFFDFFERDPKHIEQLLEYAEDGYVELAMTTRVMADTVDKSEDAGTSQVWLQIQSLPLLETIGTGFRPDYSRLNSGDYLVGKISSDTINKIASLMPGAQIEDIDHMFGHLNAGRDLFITNDKHFLNNKEELLLELGIKVIDPENAIREIGKLISLDETS